jgi:hypothetical protein
MLRRILCLGMMLTAGAAAQVEADRPHWGVQGDGGYAAVPQSIVGRFTESLPERPDISGTTFSVGLVRFHATGSPSYSFQYSQLEADLSGSITVSGRTSFVAGSGTIRGALVTMYLNVITRRIVSAGFALGAGAGQGELNYTRSVLATTLSQTNNILRFCRCSKRSRKWISVRSVIFLSRPISECEPGSWWWGSLSESTTAWLNQKRR